MDWLQNLFTDENSIAHIVLLYSFVIAVGVLLGKIKIFGVSLGVTFVLFTGIVCGHFGFTGKHADFDILARFRTYFVRLFALVFRWDRLFSLLSRRVVLP